MEHRPFLWLLVVTHLDLQVYGQGLAGQENILTTKISEPSGSPEIPEISSVLGTLKIPNEVENLQFLLIPLLVTPPIWTPPNPENLPIPTTWAVPPKWISPRPGNLPSPTARTVPATLNQLIPGKPSFSSIWTMHNLHFSISLFKRLVATSQHGNIIVSPPSLSLSLTMLGLQASPHARSQVLNGLGLPSSSIPNIPSNWIHEFFGKLLQSLLPSSLGCESQLNSMVVAPDTQKLETKFVDLAWTSYHTKVVLLPPWQNQTAKDQRNLVMMSEAYGNLGKSGQKLRTINSLFVFSQVFFKGTWKEAFDSRLTHPQPFLVRRDFRLFVPAMERQGMFRLQYCSQLKSYVLQLPYSCYSTLYLVVSDSWGPGALASIPLEKYMSIWTKPFQPRKWKLHLPKFTLSEVSSLERVLPSLGISDIFNDSNASIRGITLQNSLLSIARAFHRAELIVDERGAEQKVKGIRTERMARVRNFYFNRPFLAIILGKMNQVLFLGRVVNPLDRG